MKSRKFFRNLEIVFLITMSCYFMVANYGVRSENEKLRAEITEHLTFIDSVLAIKIKQEQTEFKYVHDRFKLYNEDIDSSTTKKFIEVVHQFNLDTTQLIYDYAISQICPTTAFSFLRYELSDEDKEDFKKLGGLDFSFVLEAKKQRKVRPELIEWLSDETNNLILWGYIMKYNLERRRYDVVNTLIIYNGGDGFFNKYLKSGKDPDNFEYVRMVKGISKRFKRKIKTKLD